MTLLDKIARAIANVRHPDKPGSDAYDAADRVIAALREPDNDTLDRMSWWYHESHARNFRAAYAAIWSDRDE
jgi:hypothetical protein